MKRSKKQYLKANERPLFAPVTSIHLTKKDKEKTRRNIKRETRKIMENLDL